MNTRVTIHPIDIDIMKRLNIEKSSLIAKERLGLILHELVAVGYDNIHSFVHEEDICFHVKKDII